MVGRDTVCVFCLTRCSTKEKRAQLLTCLHSACLECFKEQVENVKKEAKENKIKAKRDSLKNESLGNNDTDDECCEIVMDCSEDEAVVVPCLLCKVSTVHDQIQDNMFIQVKWELL